MSREEKEIHYMMTYEKFQAMLLNNNMDILVYNLYYKNHFRFFSLILNTTYTLTIAFYGGSKFPSWLGYPSFSVMVELTLKNCKKSVLLPNLGGLSVLKVLCIEGMSQVKSIGAEFYGESMNPFASLKELRFEDMPEWENWSHSNFIKEDVGTFPHLEKFLIRECPKLIGELPKCLQSLVELELMIWRCPKLESFPDSGFPPMLRRLELFYCGGLKSLPHNYNSCPLEDLSIRYSPFLKCFPNGELPTTLKKLHIGDCQSLESLPEGVMHHNSTSSSNTCCLEYLGLSIPNLEYLQIDRCENLKSLTHQMRNLKSLRSLTISECPGLESFPEEGLASNLKSLLIGDCMNLKTPISEWGFNTLTSLSQLTIWNMFPNMVSFPDEECLLPISLISLRIRRMGSLASLDLHKLISLRSLGISYCPNLRSLGPLPATLTKLVINYCPTIEERYLKEGGEYWSNVAHIPRISRGS
ncbi:unnamed protein product, partial [Vitis vinifera]